MGLHNMHDSLKFRVTAATRFAGIFFVLFIESEVLVLDIWHSLNHTIETRLDCFGAWWTNDDYCGVYSCLAEEKALFAYLTAFFHLLPQVSRKTGMD